MIPIINFADQYEKQEINYEEIELKSVEMAKAKFKFKQFDKLHKEKLFMVKAYMRECTKEMTIKRRKEMIKKAPEIILRHCRYQNPKIIALEHVLAGDFEDVWVTAMLLPSGKNEWLIRSNKDQEISRHIKKYGRDGVKLLDY